MTQKYQWIDHSGDLKTCCDALSGVPAIGIDTEFERIRTYFAKLALVQLCDPETVYLIDPLAIEDLSPLWDLLVQKPCIKVFHSAGEDLELINRLAGSPPNPLFDTQVAAALLGGDLSIGYQRMISEEFGEEVDKGASRSNWMKRPLSERQLTYAVADVAYLLPLHERFSDRLSETSRWAWFEEEMNALRSPERLAPDPAGLYQRFSGAWNFGPGQLTVLRDLLIWREKQAQRADVPKGWMLADETVRDIVYNQPGDLDALAGMKGIEGGTVRHRGEKILSVVKKAMQRPKSEQPPALDEPPRGPQYKALISDLREALKAVADENDIRPELLANKRDLLRLIPAARAGNGVDAVFSGWRLPLVQNALRDALARHAELL